MAKNFTDRYYYRDDELIAVDLEPVVAKSKISVYEVIRIIGGQPLFLEDHIERLKGSLHSFGLEPSRLKVADFSDTIASLCSENDKDCGNIEILVTADDEKIGTVFVGFIPHKYPKESDYRHGVRVGIIEAERENPNTKVKDTDARLAANEFLAGSNCFEVLLKNRKNQLTEGSRSNFFYFRGATLFSPPVAAILPGITRKYVLIAAAEAGLEIYEDFLTADQVRELDAAFLSGTSLGVLPISHIDKHKLNPEHEQLQKLMKAYRGLVESCHLSEPIKKSTADP